MARKFILTVDLDNDAFADDAASELSLILYETARHVADGITTANIRDVNGNTVGMTTITDDAETETDQRAWRELHFTPFTPDENTGQPPDGTVYLFNMPDGTNFTDRDGHLVFTKVSDGPMQGACLVRQGQYHAYWMGDQIFRPIDSGATGTDNDGA